MRHGPGWLAWAGTPRGGGTGTARGGAGAGGGATLAPGGAMNEPGRIRASDQERDVTATRLQVAFGEGRLDEVRGRGSEEAEGI